MEKKLEKKMNLSMTKKLAITATAFALVVVLLGAFTRLSHAGLGCPDWPGCYGFSHIPTQNQDIEIANSAFPERPYEFEKAWPEMVHRYFAATLGLFVLALALLSLKAENFVTRRHSFGLLVLVIFQAALGMWTVTMKLHPGIVMAHLMGGFTTLVLLASLSWRYTTSFVSSYSTNEINQFKKLIIFSLIILTLQIMLGGWTSANYAATICFELPICQGDWFSNSDYISGFTFWGHGAENYEFGILDAAGRIAIHTSHRVGAIITTLVLSFLCFKLIKQTNHATLNKFGILIMLLLVIQIFLGIFNITYKLPLYNAVAHNGVGALLLLTMGLLLTSLSQSSQFRALQKQSSHNKTEEGDNYE
ncbi:MAG: cytochrome c oxidase assembly protein subunit 15 [Polaribacter sp.]|jgi:cytochrome c oxidase assembly protein subunit 15